MTLSIAVRYAGDGIRCNAISPGPTRSEIAGTDVCHPDGLKVLFEIAGRSLERWAGTPEDIAKTALFLCSDEAKHVNGANVAVDGGMAAC